MTAKIIPYTLREYKFIGDSLVCISCNRFCEYEDKLTVKSTDQIFTCYDEIAEFLRTNPNLAKFPILRQSGGIGKFPFISLPSREPVGKHSYIEFYHLNDSDNVCCHAIYEIQYSGEQIGWKK